MIPELITETICRVRLAVSGNVLNGESHRVGCSDGSSLEVQVRGGRGQSQVRQPFTPVRTRVGGEAHRGSAEAEGVWL